jgi:hypothetical protein
VRRPSSDVGAAALTGEADTMRLWEVSSGKERGRFEGHRGEVLRAVFCATNRYIVSAGADGTVRIWDVGNTGMLRNLDLGKDGARALAVSSDGRRLLAGGASGAVRTGTSPPERTAAAGRTRRSRRCGSAVRWPACPDSRGRRHAWLWQLPTSVRRARSRHRPAQRWRAPREETALTKKWYYSIQGRTEGPVGLTCCSEWR